MKYMTINNRKVSFEEEKNVLDVIRKHGIELPTFCYHSELSTYGACRMCVVEDDRGKIFASCSEVPKDGMVIYTNTPKLQHHRKMILELLIASHCTDCTTCRTNGDCILLRLSNQLGVNYIRFKNDKEQRELDRTSNAIVFDANKCILCGDCVRTCNELQGVGVFEFANRGYDMRVTTAFDRKLEDTNCVGCGQCRTVCPTGAITIKQNVHPVWKAINDPGTKVIAMIAPSVRVAVGAKFGMDEGSNAKGKLVAALRRMGFDEVYDTNFAADLTVMEESAEFLERIKAGENLPLFTSCCPAWVRYCEKFYPDLAKHLSTCRSPQGMFGGLIREYERNHVNDDKNVVVVSIMPCTAKKDEILRPEHATFDGERDIDYVLTTTEVARMIRESGINLREIPAEAMDMPFGVASGGATIFGVTGGVTEAVLRRIMNSSKADVLENISFTGIRGNDSVKEASVQVGDRTVNIAVVNGLANAKSVMDDIRAGKSKYDFVEVMSCRNGCIAGGGQPLPVNQKIKDARTDGIYDLDSDNQIKISNENPFVTTVYDTIINGQNHKLLHNEKDYD